jgi:glucan 1,3-beta-glucosidase
VRQQLDKERAAVAIHDSFRPFVWDDFMVESDRGNVILDTHLYQCFSDEDRQRNFGAQIEVAVERKRQLDRMQKQHACIVGEWSLGLTTKSLAGLDSLARDAAMRAFGAAQLVSYESTRG